MGDAVMPHPYKDARMAKTTDNKDLKPDTRLIGVSCGRA